MVQGESRNEHKTGHFIRQEIAATSLTECDTSLQGSALPTHREPWMLLRPYGVSTTPHFRYYAIIFIKKAQFFLHQVMKSPEPSLLRAAKRAATCRYVHALSPRADFHTFNLHLLLSEFLTRLQSQIISSKSQTGK